MKKLKKFGKVIIFVVFLFNMGCDSPARKTIIKIKNNIDLLRQSETVIIPLDKLRLEPEEFNSSLLAKDISTGTYKPTQVVDLNGDSLKDALIFQVDIAPYSTKSIELVLAEKTEAQTDTLISTFSRFVPERIDDYAWENDRVAFRTYGPEAGRLVKDGEKGGTLSSGIDCWLKRVNYPIINKWYKKATEGKGTYHVDSGEGLDNYHVGTSRGCGGIGIRKGDTVYASDNFVNYKIFEISPIRTCFELAYAPWDGGGEMVKEKKRISLDQGSNLTKIEVQFEAPYPEEVVAGLAIPGREGKGGIITADRKAGWFSFWSNHNDSELGIGLVADPKYITGYTEYRVEKIEKSHVFVHLRPIEGKITYYTGFGWKKSGEFETKEHWNRYLSAFTRKLGSPLEIEIVYK